MWSASENQNLYKSWPVQAASTELHLAAAVTRIYNQTSTAVFHNFVFLLLSLFWSTYTTYI